MSKPCEGLRDKKYGDILIEEKEKEQLANCLNNEVFKMYGMRTHSFSEKGYVTIQFTRPFFNQEPFIYHSKLSETRIKRFYKIMRTLSGEFNGEFRVPSTSEQRVIWDASEFTHIVDEKPSLTNPRMKVVFKMKQHEEKGYNIKEMKVQNLVHYLKSLWRQILNELAYNGYDFRTM